MMSDAKKLTLTVASASLLPPVQQVAISIEVDDSLSIRGVTYGALSVQDNLHGCIIVTLGEP
jgi:hypothetical protein